MEEGSKEIQEVETVKVEGGSSSNFASGGEKVSYMEVVPYRGEELKINESLFVNPIAVFDAQELPGSISSDWVFRRVKNFCHVTGGFLVRGLRSR